MWIHSDNPIKRNLTTMASHVKFNFIWNVFESTVAIRSGLRKRSLRRLISQPITSTAPFSVYSKFTLFNILMLFMLYVQCNNHFQRFTKPNMIRVLSVNNILNGFDYDGIIVSTLSQERIHIYPSLHLLTQRRLY